MTKLSIVDSETYFPDSVFCLPSVSTSQSLLKTLIYFGCNEREIGEGTAPTEARSTEGQGAPGGQTQSCRLRLGTEALWSHTRGRAPVDVAASVSRQYLYVQVLLT